jgi:hypothetical protein
VKVALNKRDAAFRLFRRSCFESDKNKYNTLRKKGCKQVKRAKKHHIEKVFGGTHTKLYWQEVKKLIKPTGVRILTITDSTGATAHSSQEKAEMLSKQYAYVWSPPSAALLQFTSECTTCDKHKCTRG